MLSQAVTDLSGAAPVTWDFFLGAGKEVLQSGIDRTRSKVAEVVDTLQKNPFQVGTLCEVLERGAILRENESLDSAQITHLPHGVLVQIEEINGRRARVRSDTTIGWLSVTSSHGKQLLSVRTDLTVKEGEANKNVDSTVSVSQEDFVALHKEVHRLRVENASILEELDKSQRL